MPDYMNPPFDPRIYALPHNGATQPIQRGYLITAQTSISKNVAGIANKAVRFLYNPSTISWSYSADLSLLPAYARPGGGFAVSYQIGTVSFDLLFDRTYEVWSRSALTNLIPNAQDFGDVAQAVYLQRTGVMVDINAFRSLTGILPDAELGLNTSKDIGPVLAQSFYLVLGQMAGIGLQAAEIHGYISSLGIQVTHWAYDMVPTRAVVNITMQLSTKEAPPDPEADNALDPTQPDYWDPNKPDPNADSDSSNIPGTPGFDPNANRKGGR